jgi:PAS domain S-box-containing protein
MAVDDSGDTSRDDCQLLAYALERIDEGILISEDHDDWTNSRIRFANGAIEQITGLSPQDLVGSTPAALLRLVMPAEASNALSRARISEYGYRGEVCYQVHDGSLRDIELVISSIKDISGRLTHYVTLHRDLTERNALQRQILHAVRDEQSRIGQALHDGVLQEVSGIRLEIGALASQAESLSPSNGARLRTLSDRLHVAEQHLRGLALGLVPNYTEGHDLASALRELATGIDEHTPLQCSFSSDGDIGIDEGFIAEQLFLIAREAAWNSVTHSQGSRIQIGVTRQPEGVNIQVTDDGRGFSSEERHPGLGMATMRFRSDAIGAAFVVRAQNGRGTRVECFMPSQALNRLQHEGRSEPWAGNREFLIHKLTVMNQDTCRTNHPSARLRTGRKDTP